MKRKPKATLGARISDRTKWILQEFADFEKTTLSDLVSDILDDVVNCCYDSDNFRNNSCFSSLGEIYDEYSAMDKYDTSEMLAEIEKIDTSSPRLYNSSLNEILGKIVRLQKFGLLTQADMDMYSERINQKYEESCNPANFIEALKRIKREDADK